MQDDTKTCRNDRTFHGQMNQMNNYKTSTTLLHNQQQLAPCLIYKYKVIVNNQVSFTVNFNVFI
jgi:hypothetical protein